jgi:hypothetical protein
MVWHTFLYQAALQPAFAEMNAQLIEGWLARITGLLEDARASGELREPLDIELEALAIWAYSAGVGQLGLLHPASMPPDTQMRLIRGYLDKLRSS